MKHKYIRISFLLFLLFTFKVKSTEAQQDTLNVMAYNVLHFGDGCQGSNTYLEGKLRTIVQYANPDVLGLVKVQSIKVTPTDNNGLSPYGFADSIIQYSLDVAYPARYNYCTLTNISGSNDMDVLFYDQNKLGFLSVKNLISLQEDFDLYKLYYKDPHLTITHDTTFLYFILNHTVSGTSSTQRDQQDTLVIDQLEKIFYHLPNLISMGDFNTHLTGELGYQRYVNNSDTNFLFYDPPFNPDHNLSYPIDWDISPTLCSGYLNTSTRESSSYPNSCGTNNGAKDWYIHIFASAWLTHNFDYIKYIPDSYVTLGNDGNRVGISENDSTTNGRNNSAPSNVVNAIFFLSDKYPTMLKLAVTNDSLGNGPPNPVINGTALVSPEKGMITVNNPIQNNKIEMNFSSACIGENCELTCYDIYGRNLFSNDFVINSTRIEKNVSLSQGTYFLRVQTAHTLNVYHLVKL